MSSSIFLDRDRQEAEILALSSIYDANEFCYSSKNTIRCCFNIFLNKPDSPLEVIYAVGGKENTSTVSSQKCFIEFLPPVRLYVEIPDDYPSKNPPSFYISICWLPPWGTSFVCQKLDDMWEENKGCEILFLWVQFLKNRLYKFLNIQYTLDVSFLHMLYENPNEYLNWGLLSIIDVRAKNRALFLNPITCLIEYNKEQRKVVFERSFYRCFICLGKYSGQKCIELKICKHIYCKECMEHYVGIRIKEDRVIPMSCPSMDCSSEITVGEIKELCPNLFSKYEELTLQLSLMSMNDVIFCPRISCRYPCIRDTNETLASCGDCGYNFCSYCRKVYHGVTPCAMASEDRSRLIQDYQNADKHQRMLLEKRYGRKQLQIIVEKHLTKEYLRDNAKPCPNCQTFIAKIDGCNKMTCIHCQTSFCWICGSSTTTENAYDHFINKNGRCYGKLFEGVDKDLLNNLDNIVIEENMFWFNA